MSTEAIISALIGAGAGVGFPAAIAWRLLSILERKFDARMATIDKRLSQIAILLAAGAPPEVRAVVGPIPGENGASGVA